VGRHANAGQTCSGIERVYVLEEVAERFIAGVARGAQALRVGDPMRWETEIGLMISREQSALVAELVDDAIAAGATLHCGGPLEQGTRRQERAFLCPAALSGVTQEIRIMPEETFGPVLPIAVVESEDEAVACANDS
jgi:acyl-CoA reductase-like NAD-dependent aldehyde dehydrogenase